MEEKYIEIFKKLGIKTEPLPANYDPETFGKNLLEKTNSLPNIEYSTKTEIINSDFNQIIYFG
jgi:hypothetical protein